MYYTEQLDTKLVDIVVIINGLLVLDKDKLNNNTQGKKTTRGDGDYRNKTMFIYQAKRIFLLLTKIDYRKSDTHIHSRYIGEQNKKSSIFR